MSTEMVRRLSDAELETRFLRAAKLVVPFWVVLDSTQASLDDLDEGIAQMRVVAVEMRRRGKL